MNPEPLQTFPSPIVAYTVLGIVSLIIVLAGLAWMAEGARKRIKRSNLAKRFEAVKTEQAHLRWLEEIKQPQDVEPV